MMASSGTTSVKEDDGVGVQSSDEIEMVPPSLESIKKNPTEQYEDFWIHARNKTSMNNITPKENCGKWLIFEPFDKIDEVWATMKRETEMGELGFASKVSTMKDKGKLICQS